MDATSCCEDSANSPDTQSLVLGQFVIAEPCEARKRGIKKINRLDQGDRLRAIEGSLLKFFRAVTPDPISIARLGFQTLANLRNAAPLIRTRSIAQRRNTLKNRAPRRFCAMRSSERAGDVQTAAS